MRKKIFTTAAFMLSGFYLTSCVTVAPVHSSFEKAGTLGKGNVELMGSYTHHVVGIDGESEPINNNIGFRAGYGLTDKVDLKVRYENLMPVEKDPDVDLNASYFSVIPKFNFVPGKLSLFVPVSMYRFKSTSRGNTYTSSSYSIAPHLIKTFTDPSNKIDFSPSVNVEYLFDAGGEDDGNFLMGFNVGAGFSTDLRKWALRPEVGYLFDPGERGHIWNFGVALQFVLPAGKRSK